MEMRLLVSFLRLFTRILTFCYIPFLFQVGEIRQRRSVYSLIYLQSGRRYFYCLNAFYYMPCSHIDSKNVINRRLYYISIFDLCVVVQGLFIYFIFYIYSILRVIASLYIIHIFPQPPPRSIVCIFSSTYLHLCFLYR